MKFQSLLEKVVGVKDDFIKFVKSRAEGALKIQRTAEQKGGYAVLTGFHFAGKVKPYAEGLRIADRDDRDDLLKEKYKVAYAKLRDLDSLSQRQFQFITGELEAYGEMYVKTIKPNSIKLD